MSSEPIKPNNRIEPLFGGSYKFNQQFKEPRKGSHSKKFYDAFLDAFESELEFPERVEMILLAIEHKKPLLKGEIFHLLKTINAYTSPLIPRINTDYTSQMMIPDPVEIHLERILNAYFHLVLDYGSKHALSTFISLFKPITPKSKTFRTFKSLLHTLAVTHLFPLSCYIYSYDIKEISTNCFKKRTYTLKVTLKQQLLASFQKDTISSILSSLPF